jgi:hypothetical protein
MERVAQRVTDRAASGAKDDITTAMAGAGLGRLARVIGAGSDLRKGRIHRSADGFSASGFVFIRGSGNPRTVGAIQAYTEGADIRPKRGSYLWIASKQIPAKAGRNRMTPELYNSTGLDQRIGPLVFVPGHHRGTAWLIVESVSVNRASGRGARALPRKRALRGSRSQRLFIVAFTGIRRTSRTARFNSRAITKAQADRMPQLVADELSKIR